LAPHAHVPSASVTTAAVLSDSVSNVLRVWAGQVRAHHDGFITVPYEGFAGSTCSWQLLSWMNAQFGWRVSPAAFMSAERRHSLETTANNLRELQVRPATLPLL